MCSSAGSAGRICLQGPSGSSDAAYQHAQPQMISAKSHNPIRVAACCGGGTSLTSIEVHVLQGVACSLQRLYDVLVHPHVDFRVRQVVACTKQGSQLYCSQHRPAGSCGEGPQRHLRKGGQQGHSPSARAAARSPYPGGDTPIKAVALLQCTSAKGFLYPCAEKRSAPTAYALAVKQACQYCAQGQPQSIQVHRLYRAGWIRTMHARAVPAQTPRGGTSATA